MTDLHSFDYQEEYAAYEQHLNALRVVPDLRVVEVPDELLEEFSAGMNAPVTPDTPEHRLAWFKRQGNSVVSALYLATLVESTEFLFLSPVEVERLVGFLLARQEDIPTIWEIEELFAAVMQAHIALPNPVKVVELYGKKHAN